jgi:YbbR domain-containing protein
MKDFIFHNWTIKVLCVVFSGFLWYALKVEETIMKTIPVYVSPKISSTMFLVSATPTSVNVIVSGRRRVLQNLETRPFSVEVDLSVEKEPKTFQRYFKEESFSFNPQVKILEINPEKVDVELDRLTEKTFNIQPTIEGHVSANFELTEVKLFPSRLKIRGPEKIFAQIQSLAIEKINVQGMSTNFMQQVALIPPYEGFHHSEKIQVFVNIVKSKEEREFKNSPVRVLQPAGKNYKCVLTPTSVSFKVSASRADFQNIQDQDFIPFVDISGFSPGVRYELPLNFVKKEAFKVVEMLPQSVEVQIQE